MPKTVREGGFFIPKKKKSGGEREMQIEVRADGTAKISGYVNVTEKKSRPICTPRGQVVEEIEPRAFRSEERRVGKECRL